MAPVMAIAYPRGGGVPKALLGRKGVAGEEEVEELRRRNEELEREVREGREREEKLGRELNRVMERLRMVEEAEERLCSQLGELEAEAVAQARSYHLRINDLCERLADAQRMLHSSSSSSLK
ncbi:hypothetical protein J5N97_029400 [Dioscorea zingiberensis]|uniref:Uncharacterized protein n=1 Tax=Dioscorea zingiberensis TaxID=325984 RepID=A0A9D5H5T2_9LILI|nr:hypothetical protein J5N97_029400 [Dioscorea zingiberensis]